MHSPNPGQPIPRPLPVPSALGRGPSASASMPSASAIPSQSVSSANAIAAFNPMNLMQPSSSHAALKAKAGACLERIRAEEAARDASLRRAHLLMLSLGRDYNAANHHATTTATNTTSGASAKKKTDLLADADDYALDAASSSPSRRQNGSLLFTTIDEVFDPFVEDFNEADSTYQRSLEHGQQIATRIEGSTHIAEASSTMVRRLDVLLSRVMGAQDLVKAMLAKRAHLTAMEGAMRAGDLKKAAEAVEGYEMAKRDVLEARARRIHKNTATNASNNNNGHSSKAKRAVAACEDWVKVGPNDDLNDFSDETDDDDAEDAIAENDTHSNDGAPSINGGGFGHGGSAAGNGAGEDGLNSDDGFPDKARQNTNSHFPSTTPSTAPPKKYRMTKREERALVRRVKDALLEQIRNQMRAAMEASRRDEVVRLVQLLAKVQPSSSPTANGGGSSSSSSRSGPGEACVSYVQWVCDGALKELTAMVDGELKTLKGAKNTEQSHLASASAALDHVVATLEHEEGFVAEAFGHSGLTTLLETLHKRCTADVVRIIRDYLQTRKIGGTAAATARQSSAQQRLGEHININNAKKLDQTLEEIAHLVCCCHMYMSYVDERFHEAQQQQSASNNNANANANAKGSPKTAANAPTANAKAGTATVAAHAPAAPSAFDRSHYSAFVTKDNPLFEAIQELLAVYIPMQREYFEAAAVQSMGLDRDALGEFATAQVKDRLKKLGTLQDGNGANGGAAGGGAAAGGLFGTLGSLVNSANPSAAAHQNVKEVLDDPSYALPCPPPEVVFVEDLFYVLRIAVHRSFSTRSNTIASSVLVAVTDTITDTVAKEVLRHMRMTPYEAGPVLRGSPNTLGGLLSSAGAASAGIGLIGAGKSSAKSEHTQQQLQQLFADLTSGRNLYSTTVWLTPELLAREGGGGAQQAKQQQESHFLDMDPMTMLPTGRSGSNVAGRLSSPSPSAAGANMALTAAETSTTIHSARLFQWVAAAFSMCQYLRKLTKDIDPLAQQYFGESRENIVRFREQRQEMEATAFWLEENVKLAFCELCQFVAESSFVSKRLLRGFIEQRYDMSEEEFNKMDQLASAMSMTATASMLGMGSPRPGAGNGAPTSSSVNSGGGSSVEPWVPALTAAWASATRHLRAQLAQREEVFELLMSNVIEWVAMRFEHAILPEGVPTPAADGSGKVIMTYPHSLKAMHVNDYGALQLDKEVRQLRGYFLNAVEGNVPVRERFARLTAIASILLVDRLQDVQDVCQGIACLTAEEKKRVLLLKTTLPPGEVRSLKL